MAKKIVRTESTTVHWQVVCTRDSPTGHRAVTAQDITILPSPTQPRLVAAFCHECIHILVLGPTAANGRATGSRTQGRAGKALRWRAREKRRSGPEGKRFFGPSDTAEHEAWLEFEQTSFCWRLEPMLS